MKGLKWNTIELRCRYRQSTVCKIQSLMTFEKWTQSRWSTGSVLQSITTIMCSLSFLHSKILLFNNSDGIFYSSYILGLKISKPGPIITLLSFSTPVFNLLFIKPCHFSLYISLHFNSFCCCLSPGFHPYPLRGKEPSKLIFPSLASLHSSPVILKHYHHLRRFLKS